MGIESYNHRSGSRLAVCQAVFAVLTIVCGSVQAALSPRELKPFATGWWLGWSFALALLHVPAVATGFAAARSRSRCAITANMVVNILVVVLVSTVQVFTYLTFTVTVATLDDVDQLMQMSENSAESSAANIAANVNVVGDTSDQSDFHASVGFENDSGDSSSTGSFRLSALFFGKNTKVYLALCIAMMVLGIAQMIVTIWSSAVGCNVICCGNSETAPAYVPLQNPGVIVTMQQPVEVAQPVNAQVIQHPYGLPPYNPAQASVVTSQLPRVETQHGYKV